MEKKEQRIGRQLLSAFLRAAKRRQLAIADDGVEREPRWQFTIKAERPMNSHPGSATGVLVVALCHNSCSCRTSTTTAWEDL